MTHLNPALPVAAARRDPDADPALDEAVALLKAAAEAFESLGSWREDLRLTNIGSHLWQCVRLASLADAGTPVADEGGGRAAEAIRWG